MAGRVSIRSRAARRPEQGVAVLVCVLLASAGGRAFGQQASPEPIDTPAIERIKAEGFERSQVMEIMSWLTDVHGPRLTGSPISKRAGDWTLEQFNEWGLANAGYEWWGPFGRGWVNERMVAQVFEPVPFPVIAYPGAWTDGTDGPVRTEVVMVPNDIRTANQFAPYRGRLNGRIVVSQPPSAQPALFNAPARRYTREELDRMANPYPVGAGGRGGTDHQSFDAVGLPRFQFIQDPVEYGSRTHHSSQDLYERVQEVDMKHNAVVVAAFVYLTANRDELLPRKPLPQPAAGGGGFGGGRGGQQPVGCPVR